MYKHNNLRKDFMDKGYCILENALSPEEIQSLLVKTEEVLSLDDHMMIFLELINLNIYIR